MFQSEHHSEWNTRSISRELEAEGWGCEEGDRQSVLAWVQWLFSDTTELDGREIGPDGKQILDS